MNTCLNEPSNKEFIEAFKNTIYYQRLFETCENILGIFILGSRSTGLIDEKSDYDLVILTLNGNYIDSSRYEYLLYKNKQKRDKFFP